MVDKWVKVRKWAGGGLRSELCRRGACVPGRRRSGSRPLSFPRHVKDRTKAENHKPISPHSGDARHSVMRLHNVRASGLSCRCAYVKERTAQSNAEAKRHQGSHHLNRGGTSER